MNIYALKLMGTTTNSINIKISGKHKKIRFFILIIYDKMGRASDEVLTILLAYLLL